MPETNPHHRYLSFVGSEPYRRFIPVKETNPDKKAPPSSKPIPSSSAHGSYGPLLLHPKWKLKRKEILTRDMNRCVHCKGAMDLQIHHRQYHFIISQQRFRLPWEYPDKLLITLCEPCHRKGHNKFKVPTIHI